MPAITHMSPQQTIAHYRITAKLGEGGMGEVWRATDTKLNRDVAIKVLPDSFAQDPDRMARFTREATSTSWAQAKSGLSTRYGTYQDDGIQRAVPRVATDAVVAKHALIP